MRRNESDGTGIRCIPHPAADFGIGLGGTGPSTGGSGFGGVCRAAARYWPVNRRFRFWRSVPGGCTSHQIHNVQVEKILLRELRRITAYAHEHEDDFVQLVTRQSEKELNRQLRDSNRELAQAEARIQKLDVIMQRLYEDNVDGKISDERFARMAKTYEDEQRQLESRKVELDAFIVRKYTDITELTAEIIRTFVEKIEVMKPEKVPGTRTKKQTIVIHWNFIGAVEIPDTKEKTA